MKRLEVQNLAGGYEKNRVLQEITFSVSAGEIVGLIGPNGAGKTTLMKTLLGILPSISGSVRIDGELLEENQEGIKGKIAYIPEIPYLYDELTLEEHLQFTAMCCGVQEREYRQRVDELLKLFQMEGKLNHFPNSFSKGMRQKVMVMCALLQRPSLLIVDEPFIGLDPRAINNFIKQLYSYKEQGMAILLSTHVLDSAEKLCDRFVVLDQGQMLISGTLQEMALKAGMQGGSLMELFDRYVEAGR